MVSKDPELRQRAAAHYLQHGNMTRTSQLFGVHRGTLRRWVERFQNGEDFRDRKRSGRPSALTTALVRVCCEAIKRRKTSSVRRAHAHVQLKGNTVSHMTVWRAVRRKLVARIPKRAPLISKKNQDRRVTFAQAHANNKWRTTLFTDEKMFGDPLDPKKRPKAVWVSKGTRPVRYTRQCAFKVMVWGGISWRGKTPLFFLDETLDRWVYTDLALKKFVPAGNQLYGRRQWWLMQDNATSHKAEYTQKKLGRVVKLLPNWPAQSPDLNPIENVWSWMETELSRMPPASSKSRLKDQLLSVWDTLSLSTIQSLIQSVPNRLKAVIHKQGGCTNY